MFTKIRIAVLFIFLFVSGLSMAQPGNALNFDGNNDVVVVPNNSALEFETGTIEVWLKPDWVSGSLNYNPSFVGIRGASGSRFSFHIRRDYSGIDIYNGAVGTVYYTFAQGVWYHIALVMKSSSTDVYINGIYKGTMNRTVNTVKTGENLNIGSSSGSGEYFKGDMDEVRIWSSQRTACEISSYRNTELVGDETNLLAYYNFNQGFAGENNSFETTLTDLTSNSFDGTLNNFTLQTTTSNWVASGADISNIGGVAVDNIPPSLTVPAKITIECGSGSAIDPGITGTATATDICDASPAITYTDTDNGSSVTRTWTATDASGNDSTGVQIITVDVTPPETPVLETLLGTDSVVVTAPTTTDACTGTITGTTSDPLKYTSQGSYTITWTFDDGHGNTTTAGQTVIVDNGQDMILNFNTNLSSGTTIILPLNGTVNVTIDWGDGNIESTTTAANLNHTYSSEGTYNVLISGALTHFGSSGYTNADKLVKVISFGSIGITDLSYAFHNAKNLTEVPSVLPAGVTNTSWMFYSAEAFNQDLNNWDVSNVTEMNNMFSNAYAFDGNISGWNVGNVTTMERMFRNTSAFNQDLNNWDVSSVVNMSEMFEDAAVFNRNISNWNVSNVQNMYYMFSYANEFNQDIGNWNTSSVTDMSWMFYSAKKFNQDLNNWNTSSVTSIDGIFSDAAAFNGDISNWDVSNASNLEEMFYGALKFNRDISGWDVSNATNMAYMFANTDSFNVDIGSWDVSNVINMSDMFKDARSFNQDIGSWNISKVTNITYMFQRATSFNQDIGSWDISNVNHTSYMFDGATSFDQDISSWNVSNATNMAYMFRDAILSTKNYDKLLNTWSTLSVKNGVPFHAGNSKYSCISEAARDILSNDFNWIISDGGKTNVTINTQPTGSTEVCENTSDVELSVEATGTGTLSYQWYKDAVEITINGTDSILAITTDPANSGTYTCIITSTCGADTTSDAVVSIIDDLTPPDTPILPILAGEDSVIVMAPTTTDGCAGTITGTTSDPLKYTAQGTYTITWTFDDGNGNSTTADQEVIVNKGQYMLLQFNTNLSNGTTVAIPISGTVDITVDWGDGDSESTTTAANLFHTYSSDGTYNVLISGTLSHYGSLASSYADKLTKVFSFGNLGITDLSNAFIYTTNLTEVPSTLPAGVTNTSFMFKNAINFNQDLNNWDVSNVTDMTHMFENAYYFNGNISSWNVGKVTTMAKMFNNATAFNQDLTNWDVSNVTDMNNMFVYASAFNGDISSWDVGQVINMESMFKYASVFNQDLNNWNVSNVVNMSSLFNGAALFNGDITNWNVSKVTNMSQMFYNTYEFNQDIGNWNVSSVTDMSWMFDTAKKFNQDLNNWDVSSVTIIAGMFEYTDEFNGNINNWNVSNVTDMSWMFDHAASFDQDISSWDVSNVTTMEDMFLGVALSTANYDALLNGWSQLELYPELTFDAPNCYYTSSAQTNRQSIIDDFAWFINDAGMATSPIVTTQVVSNITATTAVGNGTISDLGNPVPSQYGFCWSTSENPTINNNKTENGGADEPGSFTTTITGLSENTTYFIRAYATNILGTSYGEQLEFTTQNSIPDDLILSDSILSSGESNCFDAYNTIFVAGEESTVDIENGASASFIAGQSIRFLPGFHAYEGSFVQAFITTNASFCNFSGPSIVRAEPIFEKSTIEEIIPDFEKTLPESQLLKVYPNPNKGRFTIELLNFNSEVHIQVFNSIGVVVHQSVSNNESIQLDLSTVKRGIYFVKAVCEQKQFTQKIIIQ